MKTLPRTLALAGALALLVARTPSPGAAQTVTETEAVAAATEWLEMIDSERYDESVAAAAPLFRDMVGSGEAWGAFLKTARDRYPVVGARQLVLFEAEFEPEGAPAGRYARLVFQPAETLRTIETVVLVHTDGDWKVAMYGLTEG